MKLALAALALSFFQAATGGFAFVARNSCHRFGLAQLAASGEANEKSDWYDDFDPTDYEDYESGYDNDRKVKDRNNPGDDYHRRREGGRRESHQSYERDWYWDQSDVDVDEVNRLLSERERFRSEKRFDEADDIRKHLRQELGVVILDREGLWRSGYARQKGDKNGSSGGRRAVDMGPNGHDYQLAPDAGPNKSGLPDDQIHDMLSERLQCKLDRQFREADQIQEELKESGVFINDGLKEWRADGERFGGSVLRHTPRGGRRRMRSKIGSDRGSETYAQSEFSLQTSRRDEIEDLIARRMEARINRDYTLADEILDELRGVHNVAINDRLRVWSVGGDFGLNRRGRSDEVFQYTLSSGSAVPDDRETIEKMIQQRAEARLAQDYRTADTLRQTLRQIYNVVVDDASLIWYLHAEGSENLKKELLPYNRRGSSKLSPEDESKIVTLIEERDECKRDKSFGKADRIRKQLIEQFNVRVDDTKREWRLFRDEYAMSAGTSVDEETKEIVEQLVANRVRLRLEKDYDGADRVRAQLMSEHNVLMDDVDKQWYIDLSSSADHGRSAADVADGGVEDQFFAASTETTVDRDASDESL